jgi:hypothetical protein
MKRLSKVFRVQRPFTQSIPLERTPVEQHNHIYHRSPGFPTYSFLEQLQDLLSFTAIFEDLDNLVVNKDDRWLPYARSDNLYDEFQDGDWFLNGHPDVHDPEEFTIGLIIYTDKTAKGALNPTGMETVVFLLTLLQEQVCRRAGAWRPLVFIP